ncbi:MAG: response regulator transcription factor [Chloroflexi bacterium]|nr:response regulator transcription factor [Chloroflexota bacterium]
MKIMLIEDSPEIVKGVSLTFKLRWPDASVLSYSEGARGIAAIQSESPDIVILDINLPDMNGFEVLENVRRFSDVPIIILSVRDSEVDELRGLEMGADDYIVKPFSPANLLSRCKAVLRRAHIAHGEDSLPPLIAGDLHLDFATREFRINGCKAHLTRNEGKILFCLVKNEGRVVSQETIKEQVWGKAARHVDNSALKRYIYQLRMKLGDSAEAPLVILNERGVGYRFNRPQASP